MKDEWEAMEENAQKQIENGKRPKAEENIKKNTEGMEEKTDRYSKFQAGHLGKVH